MKKKQHSLLMLSASIASALLYLFILKATGKESSRSTITFTEEEKARYVSILSLYPDSLALKPRIPNDTCVYYCLMNEAFFKKMTDYGMEPHEFLLVAGKRLPAGETLFQKTHAISIMNHFTVRSESFQTNKHYILIAGKKDSAFQFTNSNTDCLILKP